MPADRATGRAAVGALAGPLLIAVVAAWLPGQLQASTARWWLLGGVLPLVVAVRVAGRGLTDIPGWRLAALPFGALAAWSAASALWVPAPGAALRVALLQLGWAAAVLVGLAAATGEREGGETTAGGDTPQGGGQATARGGATSAPSGARGRLQVSRWAAIAGLAAAAPTIWSPGGTFGNPSLLAGFLAPCLVLVFTSLPTLGVRWRAVALISAAAQATALVRSDSLAGAAAVVVGLATWVALPPPEGRWRLARFLAVPVAAALILLLPDLRQHAAGRTQLVSIAGTVAAHALPFGVGAGQLQGPFLEEQAAQVAAGTADASLWSNLVHAHDEPLQALAESGLPGLLVLFPFGAAFLRPRRSAARAALAAAITVALVSPAMYEPATAALACVCVGLCVSEFSRSARIASPGAGPPRRTLARSAALAAMLLTAALATAHLLGDRLTVRGAASNAPDTLRLAAALSLTPAPALRAGADRLLPAHPTRARLLAEEAVRHAPTPVGWLLVARAHLAAFEPLPAVTACEQAARLHPRLFAAWVDLSLARAEARDHAGARVAAAHARRLRPNDPRVSWLPE